MSQAGRHGPAVTHLWQPAILMLHGPQYLAVAALRFFAQGGSTGADKMFRGGGQNSAYNMTSQIQARKLGVRDRGRNNFGGGARLPPSAPAQRRHWYLVVGERDRVLPVHIVHHVRIQTTS